MARKTEAVVDLSACQHNLAIVRRLVGDSRIIAMVKSNGYGHGLAPIARALCDAGVDMLGVAVTQEAQNLQAIGIQKPIVIMEGFFDREELEIIAQNRFFAVIHHSHQVDLLENVTLEHPIPVWVKLDTGMHRLGFLPEEFEAIWQRLLSNPNIDIQGVMSHFANADMPHDPMTANQIQLFYRLTSHLNYPVSLANSAGILIWPTSLQQWVRPGLILYGVSPLINKTGDDFGLKPVMTLKSRLVSMKRVRQGDGVSYGLVWRAPAETVIGIVAIGYGDGYPATAPSGTPVLINGRRATLVGRVCMDMCAIDLGLDPKAQVGDTVTLWGEGMPIEEVARCANTTPYDLLCSVTQRVEFKYIKNTAVGARRVVSSESNEKSFVMLQNVDKIGEKSA